MIYIGKVRPSIMEPPIDKSIIEFFKEYDPPKVIVPDDDAGQKKLKTMGIDGFIAGQMTALIRKNDNLIYRDCLILDLDDVIVSEKQLIDSVATELKGLEFVLYPSVSHGLKGVRYRLIVPLDRAVNEKDYRSLLEIFFNRILSKVIRTVDKSNFTWSQIMLLPCITQYSNKDHLLICEDKRKLPVDEVLLYMKDHTAKKRKAPVNKFKKGGSRYRNTTTELFESLVAGCEEGNRNNRIAQITGGLLARAVDVAAVLELVKVANSYFTEPLSEEEIEATFFSIANKELSAN